MQKFTLTGLSPSMMQLSRSFSLDLYIHVTVLQPRYCLLDNTGLGFSPFARHYLGNHYIVFSSSRYLDVSVPWVSF